MKHAGLALALALLALFPGPTSAAPDAGGRTCADFDAHEWAQSVYDEDPDEYAPLEPDGDGVACPELPNGAAPAL